jgi:hypothetical protein
VLCSFLSPELINNCKVRAVKARGFFTTYEQAINKKLELEEIDNIHKIFVTEVGKWSIFDKESEIILNELAGRRKEYLENSKKTHKDRVKQSIKCGIDGAEPDDINYETSSVDIKNEPQKNNTDENDKNICNGPKEDDFFELQDDTILLSNKEDTSQDNKKIYINELKNDPEIEEQRFCLYSFLAPEGLMNTNVRSVKFRGGFSTKDDASKKAELLRKLDKDYDIFIGETGHWMEQDPDPLSVENGIYKNKKENKIMEKIHKKSYENKLNHDSSNNEENDVTSSIPKMNSHEKDDLYKKLKQQVPRKITQQEKLRKIIENRKKEKENNSSQNLETKPSEKTQEELLEERIRINKKEEDLKKLTENAKKMNQNLENFKKTLKK